MNICRREEGLKEGRIKKVGKKESTASQLATSTGAKGVRMLLKGLSSGILFFHAGSNKHQLHQ